MPPIPPMIFHLLKLPNRLAPMFRSRVLQTVWVWMVLAGPILAQDSDWFETNVRPVLVEKCSECHGPTKQWASLRLDNQESLDLGSENGPVIDQRERAASPLLARIESTDPEVRMPPPDAMRTLSPREKDAIRQWVLDGARFPATQPNAPMITNGSIHARDEIAANHWAFQPLRRTISAPSKLEEVRPDSTSGSASSIAVHWIDRYLHDTLQERGIDPLPQADRRTQIRRLHRVLTGLFPTWDDVKCYEQDSSAQAWENAIERVLYRPEVAEKWARVWMDIARYSDTKGYVYAREDRTFVFSRAYRDWLIKAFRDDLPYDRFLELQLAADHLVPPGSPDLAAMGFLTLGRRFLAIQYDIIDDRIDTTFRGLMGLTVQCARCHDHKFDPISTRDYYSFVGVFQSCIDLREEIPDHLRSQSDDFRKGLMERKQKLKELTSKHRIEANDRIQRRFADYLETQVQLEKYPEGSFNQLSTKEDLIPAIVHRWEWYLGLPHVAADPVLRIWTELAKLSKDDFESRASQVLASLDAQPGACDPVVRKHFETRPRSIREAADRYGVVLEETATAGQHEIMLRNAVGEPTPATSEDPSLEARRRILLDRESYFYIPDEAIDSTEWYWDNGTCVDIWKAQTEVDQWLMQAVGAPVELGIVRDRTLVSDARILKRGNANLKGTSVARSYFERLPGEHSGDFHNGSGRLELARRIASADNPLTARVWVNRVWQQVFGEGLVQSTSDFGLRSDPPSHPELLDALALEFIRHGWSTRWLIRELISTDAFRRASWGEHPTASEIDPSNRLLWRMNRHRLTWEESRDALLMFSGSLVATQGGKSVDPLASNDAAMARRSVYTTIDRQYLPMTLQNFDFANPDMHTPKRSETTVPQQALFLLNHPLPARAAAKLAETLEPAEESNPVSDERFVQSLYRRVLQRDPHASEMNRGVRFLHEASQETSASGLSPRAQLSQVLLICNEVTYID
ncbi:MAG: PSD1 and planctomycete cytochrome C domain-containing protein [Planctomycetota bacterium]